MTQDPVTKRVCPVCGSGSAVTLFPVSAQPAGKGIKGNVVHCRACGMHYKDFVARPSFLDDQYGADAYAHDRWFSCSRESRDIHAATARTDLRFVRRILSMTTTHAPSLLDVGCGDGRFLKVAKTCGIHGEGLEINPALVTRARQTTGCEIHQKALEELDPALTYDVVTCFEVIEHVLQPRTFLNSLMNCVRPGGVLCLSTPNHKAVLPRIAVLAKRFGVPSLGAEAKIFGSDHINFFDANTLKALVTQNNLSGRVEVECVYFDLFRSKTAGVEVGSLVASALDIVETVASPIFGGYRMSLFGRCLR